MKYRIELAATAKTEIHQQAQWLRDQASPDAANRWLAGLYKAIDTLETRPQRCPVAAERHEFAEELRELRAGHLQVSRRGSFHREDGRMSHVIAIELEIPDDLARFRLPSGVQARLQGLLDRQDKGATLTTAERQEAEGLVNLAELLSLLRLRADRARESAAGRA